MENDIENRIKKYCENTNSQVREIDSITLHHEYISDDHSIPCEKDLKLSLYSFINEYSGQTSNFVYVSYEEEYIDNKDIFISVDRFLAEFELTQFNGYLEDINDPTKRSNTFTFSPLFGIEFFVDNDKFSDVLGFIANVQSLK